MISKECAIFFDEDAFSIKTDKLMGRNSAGDSFLTGYFSYGKPEHFWVYAKTKQQAQVFLDLLNKINNRDDTKFISWASFFGLKTPGTLFYPGPDFQKLAWQRRLISEAAWSICGITHTTSSAAVMDAIGDYFIAPIKSWDALICTSNAVKQNVEFILEQKRKYLRDDLGLTRFTEPKLPVIPLGINTTEFEFSSNEKQKARSFFDIDDNTVVIAYVGRLSFHAKANPIPMYLAVEKAAKLNSHKKIKIIECGWYANDWIKNAFLELSGNLLDVAELVSVDGRDQTKVKMVWSAADIFCSFSDNIQETFGISPIEAMSSGLPVVVSDWNGYKESVRDDIDGFKVPTLMPEGGLGNDLSISYAMELDSYDRYIGKTSAFIAIDIDYAAFRFDQLIKSKELRLKMGQNGKKQATQKFDWKSIIPQYEELWSALGEERSKYSNSQENDTARPERPDPYRSFGHYSSSQLTQTHIFGFVYDDYNNTVERFKKFKNLNATEFLEQVLLSEDEFLQIFKLLTSDNLSSHDLLKNFNEDRRPLVYRNLFWLLKMGLLRIISAQ